MKKIHIDMSTLNDDQLIEEMVHQLKTDVLIAPLLAKLQAKDEEIAEHLASFLTMKEERSGLQRCADHQVCQMPQGHYLVTLERNAAGFLQRKITPCPYLLPQLSVSQYLWFAQFDEAYKQSSLFDDVGKRLHRKELYKYLSYILLNQAVVESTYIYGPPLVGKTFALATFSFKYAINERGTIAFVQAPLIVERFKDMKTTLDTRALQDYERLQKVEVLIIDQFGQEAQADKARDDVWIPLLQKRLQHKLPTMIISNFELKELLDIYAPFASQKPKAKLLVQLIETFPKTFYLPSAANL